MFSAIYFEEEIQNAPKTKEILRRFSTIPHIPIDRYQEVFNRKGQNFTLQKENPALILAKKRENFVLKTPKEYSIGSSNNYYFSHLLNCIFDCRYCFLQGMYRSGHFVFFINFEDFQEAIEKTINEHNESCFFSGYDSDSLALEPVTSFAKEFLPLFKKYPQATIELRTKSTQIKGLIDQEVIPNCVTAFSLSPKNIQKNLEKKTPSLKAKLHAIDSLQKKGWKIGLRFDPILFMDSYKTIYSEFFQEVFSVISLSTLHSVSLGAFRLPKPLYKEMQKLHPKEKLFVHSIEERGKSMSYSEKKEEELLSFCQERILENIPESLFFPCEVPL